jgi:hypothetical protein
VRRLTVTTVVGMALFLVACTAQPKPSASPPTPTPAPTPMPTIPPLSSVLVFTPPTGYIRNDELSTPTHSIWQNPTSGWMITAALEEWTTTERTMGAVAPPMADPNARQEMVIQGDVQEYPGLLTWGADGTGGGATLYWDLVVGGNNALLRFGCNGSGKYDALRTMCLDLIGKVKVTSLGAPVSR